MMRRLFLLALLALFALLAAAQDSSSSSSSNHIVDPATQATDSSSSSSSSDDDSGSSAADSAAGAEGPDSGSFKLSKGGMIAIIIVVVVVAVGGSKSSIFLSPLQILCKTATNIIPKKTVISTALFFIAKKRQWEVRKSLKRVSRRLTGRSTAPAAAKENRRTAVRVQSPPASSKSRSNRDLEKGEGGGRSGGKPSAGRNGKPTMSAFSVETPVVKSWKDKVFGYKG